MRPALRPPGVIERGGVSILVCTAAFILSLGALAVADAGSFLLARSRAQSAADAAALAAVVQQVPVLGGRQDPQSAAREEAARNGATLVSCDCSAGSPTATAVVEIRPRVALLSSWIGRRVRAQAVAEVDDFIFSYRTGESGG